MKTRFITGFLFSLVMLSVFIAGFYLPEVFVYFFVCVTLISFHEVYVMVSGHYKSKHPFFAIFMLLPYLTAVAYALFSINHGLDVLGIYTGLSVLIFPILAILYVMRYGIDRLPGIVAFLSLTMYVTLPFLMVPVLAFASDGFKWIILGVLSTWLTDTAAFYGGFTWGKKKILPQISPKKTFAGFYTGLFTTAVLVALYIVYFINEGSASFGFWIFALVSGLALGLVAQLGDWLASAIKRWFNIKDYGYILPGHGGILDRFDGVLFNLPLTFLIMIIYRFILD